MVTSQTSQELLTNTHFILCMYATLLILAAILIKSVPLNFNFGTFSGTEKYFALYSAYTRQHPAGRVARSFVKYYNYFDIMEK